MSRLAEIVSRFPIRKKDDQKEAFLRQAQAWCRQMGYAAKVEAAGKNGRHKNLVAGDAEAARVIFTAHYDTPANMILPNLIIPRNLPLFFAYQLLVVGLLVIVGLGIALGAFALVRDRRVLILSFLLVYYALLLFMVMGPANKNNVNDNTSGVAAVLRVMELLPPEQRGLAAFILFDNEEKGTKGSKAFALAHSNVKKGTLVINLDCVGVGEHLLLVAKSFARTKAEYPLLEQAFADQPGMTPHFFPSSGGVMNSDQKNFRCGVGVVACKRKKLVGYYTPDIHTRRDTEAREKNIEYAAQGMARFVNTLSQI